MREDTIVGIASGMGGGIAIIRISGEDALKIAGKIFSVNKNIKEDECYFFNKESHTINHGYIYKKNYENSFDIIDEVMISVMKAPKSYTMEDVIEIDTHGGMYITKKILELIISMGARISEPGEFTKRAFLNGRIDLSQSEAVLKMIQSENEYAAKSAMSELEGNLSHKIEEIRQEILYETGYIESALDDPEHFSLENYGEGLLRKIGNIIERLSDLSDSFYDGKLLTEGIDTAIIGKPNVGKSSLLNLLLDEERAIVTEIAGTTRDSIKEKIRLDNLLLNIIDTAGIHDTDDFVENIGVKKAIECSKIADFVIYIMDATKKPDNDDKIIVDIIKEKKGVVLINKIDKINFNINKSDNNKDSLICNNEFGSNLADYYNEIVDFINRYLGWNIINFSNITEDGLDDLKTFIKNNFINEKIDFNNQIVITNIRHKNCIEDGIKSLKNVVSSINGGMPEDFYTIDMMDAYKSLGLINGETAEEDLINKIFSEFCMGK